MGNLEYEYKEKLTTEYDKCIYELAQAEIEKKDTSQLFDRVLNIQKQIAALDVEITIDKLKNFEERKSK